MAVKGPFQLKLLYDSMILRQVSHKMCLYARRNLQHHHWKKHETIDVTLQFLVLSQKHGGVLVIVSKEEIPSLKPVETSIFKASRVLIGMRAHLQGAQPLGFYNSYLTTEASLAALRFVVWL